MARQQQQYTGGTQKNVESNRIQSVLLVWFGLVKSLTPVADHAHGRRREDEEAFTQQRKLPQHHDLLAEKLDELRHAASRVCYLHKVSQSSATFVQRAAFQLSADVALLFSYLHFGVHAAVEGGDAPGRAGRHQSVSCRGKDGPLVLVEGLQWRVLAWTL